MTWFGPLAPDRRPAGSRGRKRAHGPKGANRLQRKRTLESLEPRHLLAGDLVGHWLADDLRAEVADGEPIGVWTDSIHGVPAVASGTPKLVNAVHDGHSVVRFDAAGETDLFRVSATDSPMAGAEDFTVVAVFATALSGSGGSNLWFQNTGLVDGTRFFGATPDWGLVLNRAGQVGAGLGGPAKAVYSSSSRLHDGGVHVVVYTRSEGSMSISVDAGPADSRFDGSTLPRDVADMTFGSLQSGALPYTGDIAEIRIYDDDLAEAEVAALSIELLEFYINVPPFANDDDYAVSEDATLVVPADDGLLRNDSDIEGDPFTTFLLHQTSHGTIDLAPDGSFLYEPDPDFFGTDTFAYLVRDNYDDSAAATVTIEVLPEYDPVLAVQDQYTVDAGALFAADRLAGVLANDVNLDQAELTARLVADVTAGTLALADDGSFTYDSAGFSGTTQFRYAAVDAVGDQNTVTVTLHVDHAPVANDDTYDFTEETASSIPALAGVLANDDDVEKETLTATLVTPPVHGTLGLQEDGSFTYRPDRDYSGPDRFTYRANDGDQDSSLATVELNVLGINDRPVAREDRYFGRPNQRLTVSASSGVLANDRDTDSLALSAVLVAPTQHGTLALHADGSFTYDPDVDFHSVDQFSYRANDASADSVPVVVRLFVSTERVVISEFLAINDGVVLDYDDNDSDWIEILNDDAAEVDLEGWYLTDDPEDLTKWRIPVATPVGSGETLIVWASGRDSVTPNGELHTNFRLSGDGEFLALVQPDGTSIAWDFSPSYPPQHSNVSFGLGQRTETTQLIDARASVRVLVPRDGSLGGAWTESLFDDGAWAERTTAIGYAAESRVRMLPGFAIRMIDVGGGNDGELNSIREAETVLDGDFVPERYHIRTDVTALASEINFGGREATFKATHPYPDGTSDTSLSDIAIRATSTVTIPEGTWTIGVSGNEGALLRLADVRFINTFGENGPATDGDGEIIFDGLGGQSWARGSFTIGAGGFTTTLEALFYERAGDDSFELAITAGHASENVNLDQWTLLSDGALGWTLSTSLASTVPEFADLVASSVETEMANARSSAYLRLPFDLDDAAVQDTLVLRMQYDDAFVAYLNGVEVARGNFSGVPLWNSVADSDRDDRQARVFEEFDLTEQLELLENGRNVLAIHGLNSRPGATGFLLAAELLAVDVQTVGLGYMDRPTPGEDNQLGWMEVVRPVAFSREPGTFTESFLLAIRSDQPEATVHYTTDGRVPTRFSPLYSQPIEINNSTSVRARAFAADSLPSQTQSQTYTRLVTSLADFNSDLPIMIVDTFGSAIGGQFVGSTVTLFEPQADGRTALAGSPTLVGRAGIKVRGSSTAGFAKTPYSLELWQDHSDNDRARELLGMPADADWVLHGPYTFDRSLTRNAFIYDLSNQVGRYASRTRYIELFVDKTGDDLTPADYFGVYVLIEKIKRGEDRVDVEKLSSQHNAQPEITGGYILKIDRADPGDTGFNMGASDHRGTVVDLPDAQSFSGSAAGLLAQNDFYRSRNVIFTSGALAGLQVLIFGYDGPSHTFTVEPGFDLTGLAAGDAFRIEDAVPGFRVLYVEPKEAEIEQSPAQQQWLTDTMNQFLAALYRPNFIHPAFGHYSEYIDVPSFIDHQLLNELSWNVDAFVLSAYMFKTREGKLEAGPIWDFDRSMGSTDGRDRNPEGWLSKRTWYERLFQDPEFQQATIDRWQELRDGFFRLENIEGIIDGLAGQIDEAQGRNFERWPEVGPREARDPANNFTGALDGSWEGELNHQKTWLARRVDWIDGRFLTQPAFSHESGLLPSPISLTMTGPTGATIYYTTDGTDPRLPGGDLSPAAIAYDGSISIVATTAVTARSFDPLFDSDFVPGTESWSGLKTAIFAVETAGIADLRISEIHYNPAGPTGAELAAGHDDNDNFEFIELVNVGSQASDLTGARLVKITAGNDEEGVAFEFAGSAVTRLGPGERLLVVEDTGAFAFRYGDGLPVAGQWDGRLSNGGELLTLVVSGTTIHQFRYNDQWHRSTDGDGPSLEIIDATARLDRWSESDAWQASVQVGGTPGIGALRGDFNNDQQRDGQDIGLLFAQVQGLTHHSSFDLTGDRLVDQADVNELVENILGTTFGDTDLDGDVDNTDFATAIGQFTGPGDHGRSWELGDSDGDGDVDNYDLAIIISNFQRPIALGSASARAIAQSRPGRSASADDESLSSREPDDRRDDVVPRKQRLARSAHAGKRLRRLEKRRAKDSSSHDIHLVHTALFARAAHERHDWLQDRRAIER